MRLLLLAHDRFSIEGAKTAVGILRYRGDEVVAVVDRERAGQDAGEAVGPVAAGIPVVASVEEALPLHPDTLVVGIAPVGGGLPEAWRRDLRAAIEHDLEIVSGLHTRIGRDPELAALARERGTTIRDVREPPPNPRVSTGEVLDVDAVVVLTVGTDCSSGKMTTTVELHREARARGLDVAWVATGQTGLLLAPDAGAPVDAVVSDFVSGEVERQVVGAAADHDLVLVEGQGTLTHPAYGQVSLGLLLGAMPDLLVLCDVPGRETLHFPSTRPFPKLDVARERDLNEALLAPRSGGRVAAASLVTRGLDDAAYHRAVAAAEDALGVPAGDILRGDGGKILDGILAALEGVAKPGAARLREAAEVEA